MLTRSQNSLLPIYRKSCMASSYAGRDGQSPISNGAALDISIRNSGTQEGGSRFLRSEFKMENTDHAIKPCCAQNRAVNYARQGPWSDDLRTPPGPEGS